MPRGLSVVLVRPRFPENIGMAARAMANMGVSELILVQPEMWHKEKAAPLATAQGQAVLDSCRVENSLEVVLRPFVAAYGTTARTGGWRREVLNPEQAALQIRSHLRERQEERASRESARSEDPARAMEAAQAEKFGRAGEAARIRPPAYAETPAHVSGAGHAGASANRVALVFGPEDHGLLNAEVELCTRMVSIPTAIGNSSLNLAQAVLLLLYECMKADMALPPVPGKKQRREWTRPAGKADSRRTTMEEETLLLRTLEETLAGIGHLQEDNPGRFMHPLRRFLRKSDLRRHEFDMLMGICRKVLRISSMNNNGF